MMRGELIWRGICGDESKYWENGKGGELLSYYISVCYLVVQCQSLAVAFNLSSAWKVKKGIYGEIYITEEKREKCNKSQDQSTLDKLLNISVPLTWMNFEKYLRNKSIF